MKKELEKLVEKMKGKKLLINKKDYNLDVFFEKLVQENKIKNFEIHDKESMTEVYLTNDILNLGENLMHIDTTITISNFFDYYYIRSFFELTNLDKKIFYDGYIYGELYSENCSYILEIEEIIVKKFTEYSLKKLEENEVKEVVKSFPDIKNNYFFSQPTIEAVLFYDIYEILK